MSESLTKPRPQARCPRVLAPALIDAVTHTDRKQFITTGKKGLFSGRSVPTKAMLQCMLSPLTLTASTPQHASILHIGCGTGYVTAVLARIAHQVIAVEHSAALVKATINNTGQQNLTNVRVYHSEGKKGAPKFAPYDIIVITTPKVSDKTQLFKQLNSGGQLICLEQDESSTLVVAKYTKQSATKIQRSEHGPVSVTQDSVLLDLGLINDTLLSEAHRRAKANKTLIIDEVRRLKKLDESDLYKGLASKYGLEIKDAENLLNQIDVHLFDKFSRTFLEHQKLIPLCVKDRTLTVATSNPDAPLAELHKVLPGHQVKLVLVTPTDLQRLLSAVDLSLKREENTSDSGIEELSGKTELKDKEKLEFDAYLISVFDDLLLNAVSHRASDIHIEQYGETVRIRLRIDGSLMDTWHYDLTPRKLRGLINIIKLRAELNIAEHRLPQGGHAGLRIGDYGYDLRIQVQPSLHGEHIVIRLLPQHSELISIDKLGLPFDVANSYKRLLRSPAGLVLVVGPTGSGKSTTLYAGLQLVAADQTRKIITVEDPIEYSINNIQQTRTRPEIGFNFSDAMRSFVRQDPDVIMVGEIRDHETALKAIRASQTGHVVLSTLHCNDAVDAMQRLFNLDIQPNSLASELLAVMAQRLARRNCDYCRQPVEPDPELLNEVFPEGAPKSFRSFAGTGCNHCNGRGTHGRIAVVEYLQVNATIRNAISRQLPIDELRRQALDCGLVTMRDSALDHVIQGTIPLSEMPRILPAERMAPEPRYSWEVNH